MKRIITTAALTLTLGLTACSAPAPTTETEPAPTFTEGTYQAPTPDLAPTPTEAELEGAYLYTVRSMAASYTTAELLTMGRSVCAHVEAGVTFDEFGFPGVTELDAPVIAGAAVGVWCPELTEQAMGGELS